MSVVRNGGTGTAVVGIDRTGERGRAVARPDTVFNRQHPLGLTLLQRSCHAHAANRVPVNFSTRWPSSCLDEPEAAVATAADLPPEGLREQLAHLRDRVETFP